MLALTVFELYHPKHMPPPPAPLAISRGPDSLALGTPSNGKEETTLCQSFYQTICLRRGIFHDPTGVVRRDIDGEIQTLRNYEEIIHQHPSWNSDQVDEELVRTIYTPERRSRFEAAFKFVEYHMEQFINRQSSSVLSHKEKQLLKKRLRKVQLQLPPPAAQYNDEPDLFTKNDVYYERMSDGGMRLRVGGAYLVTAKSWFNIIFTLGHELAHSIDPCEVRSIGWAFPAYDRISSCFLKQGIVAVRKTRVECGENDQLSETFADWFAVQIVGDALTHFATEFHGQQLVNAMANSVRDLCEQDESLHELDFEFHPSPETRIERIFGHNPVIRGLLGCGPPPPIPVVAASSTPDSTPDSRGISSVLTEPEIYCSFETN